MRRHKRSRLPPRGGRLSHRALGCGPTSEKSVSSQDRERESWVVGRPPTGAPCDRRGSRRSGGTHDPRVNVGREAQAQPNVKQRTQPHTKRESHTQRQKHRGIPTHTQVPQGTPTTAPTHNNPNHREPGARSGVGPTGHGWDGRGPYDGGYAGTRAPHTGIYALNMFFPMLVRGSIVLFCEEGGVGAVA